MPGIQSIIYENLVLMMADTDRDTKFMPSKKLALVVLAAFTAVVVMMSVFFAVPSAIGGEVVGEALQSAANFTGTDDDVKEILDRFTTQEKEIIQDSKNPPASS